MAIQPVAGTSPAAVLLDGATLTPKGVARIARDGAPAQLDPAARERNDRAREAIAALLARGDELYGVTTGVGALRAYRVPKNRREQYSVRLLRSHACGAGDPLPATVVRAAMATRANQIGAGGAGVAAELLDGLVNALNAGLSPFTRELGSLGTGDLTNLADIGLALLGEGRMWRGDQLVDAGQALAEAGLEPARLGARDGLALMSSNAVSIGRAALLVVDARRLLDAWLCVAALSFEAAAADPVVLDSRIHSWRHRPGQAAVAARMRQLLEGLEQRTRDPGPLGVQDPYPFRAQPQVDGTVHDALRVLEETVVHELNFAGENALIIADDGRRAAQWQSARRAARQRDRRSAHRARAVGGADRRARQHAAGLRVDGAAAVPRPQAGSRVRGARVRVHRTRGGRRGPFAGHAGRRADGLRLARRRVALEPRTDRRAPCARDAERAPGRGRDRARGRRAGAAASGPEAGGRRHAGAVAAGDRAAESRPR